MQRLWKNRGRYNGEAIDIDAVQREIHELAIRSGWNSETFLNQPGIVLRGYQRLMAGASANIYIGSGVHGDEPSGPLALIELLRENVWPAANIWLVPCVNPTGFRRKTRENHAGVDLNRDYRHRTQPEVVAHIEWLERQPSFDLSLLLHEDWEANGFYLYEVNPQERPSLAGPIVEAVQMFCPIETANLVDGFTCLNGIIRPQVHPLDRPQWAEAVYLIAHKTLQSYTLETPSDFPLTFRAKVHTLAMREALRWS